MSLSILSNPNSTDMDLAFEFLRADRQYNKEFIALFIHFSEKSTIRRVYEQLYANPYEFGQPFHRYVLMILLLENHLGVPHRPFTAGVVCRIYIALVVHMQDASDYVFPTGCLQILQQSEPILPDQGSNKTLMDLLLHRGIPLNAF